MMTADRSDITPLLRPHLTVLLHEVFVLFCLLLVEHLKVAVELGLTTWRL